MKKITFECEIITPMFISGADGKSVELRPPSIKGLLRFWWRAMNAHLSLKNLKEKESEIFGSSGEKGGRSKVSIRVDSQLKPNDIVDTLWKEIPYEERITRKGKKYKVPSKYKGISYLLYSTHMLNERPYIKPDTIFTVTISSGDRSAFGEAVKSFIFLQFFGGLGARSRRGAGSFMLKNVYYNGKEDYKGQFNVSGIQSSAQLKYYIESKLKPLIGVASNSRYSILSGAKVYILNPKNNWKDALENIGKPFFNFRRVNKIKITETPNFGFPILHRNGTLMGAGPRKIKKNEYGKVIDFMERRASPLILKLIKTKENYYFPVIIWLNGELIPFNYSIMDKMGVNIAQPNNKIITDFLGTISNKLEVTL